MSFVFWIISISFIGSFVWLEYAQATSHAQLLFDHLFNSERHTPDVRPVRDPSKPIIMYMNLSLAQILEVNVKDQQLVTNIWVMQQWKDESLYWNPEDYGGVRMLLVPSDKLWVPDLVLYNNAGGQWFLGSASNNKVKVWYDGTIQWKPPIIFYSQCDIDVEYFPFDQFECKLKMGTWTNNGHVIDLRHFAQQRYDKHRMNAFDNCKSTVNYAIDLSEFVSNGEWDLLGVSAQRNIEFYPCCPEPYLDITFFLKLRRKTLFYGANLICPCIAFAMLVPSTFYLPSDTNQKMTLCISVFLVILVFLVVLFDLTPATSLVVPLMVKYLLFTMISSVLSIAATCLVLNIHHRIPDANKMPEWVRIVFIDWLPRFICIKRPKTEPGMKYKINFSEEECGEPNVTKNKAVKGDNVWLAWQNKNEAEALHIHSQMETAVRNVQRIAQTIYENEETQNDASDWKYLGLVVDRLFFIFFSLAGILATIFIFLEAPVIFDTRPELSSEMASDLLANVNYTRLC